MENGYFLEKSFGNIRAAETIGDRAGDVHARLEQKIAKSENPG